jgi:hypothetical protein
MFDSTRIFSAFTNAMRAPASWADAIEPNRAIMATVPNLAQFVIDTFLIFSFLTFKACFEILSQKKLAFVEHLLVSKRWNFLFFDI